MGNLNSTADSGSQSFANHLAAATMSIVALIPAKSVIPVKSVNSATDFGYQSLAQLSATITTMPIATL
jgi:hypothetical protein